LGILCVRPVVRATESPEADANKSAIGEPFGSDASLSLRLPLQTSENLSFGAVAEFVLTSHCFSRQAGIPRPLKERVWQSNDSFRSSHPAC
jgi:hypothetical protein